MSFARARVFQTETFRLAATYALVFLGSMALLVVLIFVIVSNAFEANLLRDSRDDLAAIKKAYAEATPGRELHEANEMIEDRLLATDSADVFLLQAGHKRIGGNLPVMQPSTGVLRFSYPRALGGATAGHTLLGQGELIAPGVYAFVGRDLYSARRAENELLETFVLVLVASLVLAGAGGLLLSRSFVKRVDAITTTCRGIMAGRLDERIPTKGTRNELDLLAASINAMLDRIAALMESLKQVSNDIAHDLRTPLAHLRYRLERAREDARSTDDYAVAVDAAIANCDQLQAMFAALLRIAQIEAGARRVGMQAVDLGEVLENIVGLYEPVMGDTGHPFETRFAHNLRLSGDPQLLMRLFGNLLDNAIRHTPAGGRISLTAEAEGSTAKVAVSDEGPGIPAEDREKVFRRFYRREQSRTTPGSGLGLALVAAIAELHGAEVSLDDNAPGLRAIVLFPLLSEGGRRPLVHSIAAAAGE
jgi:signal transduction histidine kinase